MGLPELTSVKHRRELLFASLPALLPFISSFEGFMWLAGNMAKRVWQPTPPRLAILSADSRLFDFQNYFVSRTSLRVLRLCFSRV